MKKIFIVLVILAACKKPDTKPTEEETTTPPPAPAPIRYTSYFKYQIAAYTQTTGVPANDTRDSTFTILTINGTVVKTDQIRNALNANKTFTVEAKSDTVQKGDVIGITQKMITVYKGVPECTLRPVSGHLIYFDKNAHVSFTGSISPVVAPITYGADGIGRASHSWSFTVN